MTTHFDDEAQAEQLKRWWKENWPALAVGLGIGLGAIFGWEAWQDHREGRAAQASQMYEDMKKALDANRSEDAAALAETLTTDFDRTPYAANAALRMAADAVQKGELDTAAAQLQWVIDHGRVEGLRQLAQLRLARVRWQQGQADAALKLLEGGSTEYAALYDELRGDIKLTQGDRAAARAAYEKALENADQQAANRDVLQRKLDELADQAAQVNS